MTTATATKAPAKNTDKPAVVVGDAVKALAAVFQTGITVAKDGTVSLADGLIENNLPDDLTIGQIKKVQKHRGEVVAALSLALSHKALPLMDKNKELEKISTSIKIGGDKLDLAIEREREFNDGSGGKLKKYGYLSVGYTATGATNAGEFKKVRQVIADEAASLFG
jgi:hypothetical protein